MNVKLHIGITAASGAIFVCGRLSAEWAGGFNETLLFGVAFLVTLVLHVAAWSKGD